MRIFTIIALFFSVCTWGQNLVFNPSFESYTNCPNLAGQLTYANGWTAPTNDDADYFNSCAVGSFYNVPNQDVFNFQLAKEGNAFGGFFAYNGVGNNYREYLQNELITDLISAECYLVTFYTNTVGYMKYATNNIGLHFSSSVISSNGNGEVLNLAPHILKLNNPIISDTMNWIEIKGVYTAIGNERYLIIGNFFQDQNTSLQNINNNGLNSAYYFIDDVSVISISDLPNSMPAYAGADTSILVGDSVFIGQEISNLNCTWSVLGGSVLATNTSGVYVQPTETTTYVVEQNLCGVLTYDSITLTLHGLGVSSLEVRQKWVTVVPNPNNGDFELDLSQFKGENVSIQILDASGRLVFENEGGTDSKLKIETNLNKGVYFMKLRTIKGVFEEKIVIQ